MSLNLTGEIKTQEEFEAYFSGDNPGFAWCFAADNESYEAVLAKYKVTPRCIPVEGNDTLGTCIFTGEAGQKKIVFAKAY